MFDVFTSAVGSHSYLLIKILNMGQDDLQLTIRT